MGRMTEEDRSLIFNLRVHKGWGSWRMMKEFPHKMWNRRTVDNIIKRIEGYNCKEAGKRTSKICSNRGKRRGGERSDMQSGRNTAQSLSPREIERHTGISRSSIQRIVKKDLALKQYKSVVGQRLNADCKLKRLHRSHQLLLRFPTDRSVLVHRRKNIYCRDSE